MIQRSGNLPLLPDQKLLPDQMQNLLPDSEASGNILELLLMQKLLLYQKHLSQQEHFFKVGKVFMVLLECRFLDKFLFLFLNFEKFTINGTERQLYWP